MTIQRSILTTATVLAALLWTARAEAFPGLYTDNCAACHSPTVTTCNGCHAHGTHSSDAKTDINIAGTLDSTSYAPGETVTVTITGGYRTGWIRALLFDQGMNELARSSCPGGLGGCTTSVFPVTLTAPAPTTPGTYTWAVAWYGNQFDSAGASFGSGTSATLQPGFFTPDANNANHGFQTVALPPFTVAAPSAPSIALSPASLTFPTVTLGGSAQLTTQVQNTGTAPLNVTSISLCAGTSAVFSWSPSAPFEVAPGGSTTLTVTYTPTVEGTQTGCLALASNDPVNPTVNLAVTGTAVTATAPGIALVPPALSFGSVMVGATSSLTTQVQNTGTETLNVTAIALCSGTSAEYTWSPSAPIAVLPGESANLTVTYAPTGTGTDTGCLALTSNAATSPTELPLSGTGTAVAAPAIALVPSALDFGAVLLGGTSMLPVQVQNTGTASLTVTSISLCSGTSSAFEWSPAAPFTVEPGQAEILQVSYAPVLAGPDTGCLAIASNDPAQPIVNLGLSGSGVTEAATPSIALVPPALDFGTVFVGSSASLTTQIQNEGTAPLNITAIARCTGTSDAFSWSPAAPFTVAAAQTTTLTVTYTPTAAQTDAGCLVVSSDDPANPTVNLAVTGTGVAQPVAGLDIDLNNLAVPGNVNTNRVRAVTPKLAARNASSVDGTASATLVGVLDGTEVYREVISIDLAAGEGGQFQFPTYTPEVGAEGTIIWTATIADDDDPDVDQVTATTRLQSRGRGGFGGDESAAAAATLLTATTPQNAGCSSGGSANLLALALTALALARRRRIVSG